MTSGRGTWIREADGDVNPGWLLFAVFAVVVAVGGGIGYFVAARGGSQSLAIAGLAASVTGMLACGIVVVPIAKAKLLAKGLGPAAGSITAGGASPVVGVGIALGMDNPMKDDESDQ